MSAMLGIVGIGVGRATRDPIVTHKEVWDTLRGR